MKIVLVFVLIILITLQLSTCEAAVESKCTAGWKGFGRKCYRYITEAKPWIEAEKYCQQLGGNLASVHSNQTQYQLKRMGKISGKYHRTWIGAQDAVMESTWLWSDGSLFDFMAWHSGEPSHYGGYEHCVEMNYGDEVLWNDARCNTELYFLCQKAANSPNTCKRR